MLLVRPTQILYPARHSDIQTSRHMADAMVRTPDSGVELTLELVGSTVHSPRVAAPRACIQIMYKHVSRNVQFIIANKCRSCCVQHSSKHFSANYCTDQRSIDGPFQMQLGSSVTTPLLHSSPVHSALLIVIAVRLSDMPCSENLNHTERNI